MVANTRDRPRPGLARWRPSMGMVAERLSIDVCADRVSDLSGDDGVHDPVEDLVVTLRRKGVITDQVSEAALRR